MPRVHTREKIIPIQRADSSFQDFDGFGCVLFDTSSSLDLYCKKSRRYSIGINWNTDRETKLCYNVHSEYCIASLNLPKTGNTHMDCTEQLDEDMTTVRIFFIHKTNDTTIPSSEKDCAGCLNYVTRYNSPDDSNGESKTILSNNSRKRQKGGLQNTNISNSPPPQNRPTRNRSSQNNSRTGTPAQRPTSPRQPNTQHHKHNEPSPPKNSPSANNIFPISTSPPTKSPSQFEHKHNKTGHIQFQNNNDDKPLLSPPPNTKTDINIKNKDVHSWWPKLSTTVNSPIANSTLATPTVFRDFNNKTAWPDLDPATNATRQSKNTIDVAGSTALPLVSHIVIIIVVAAVGFIALIILILYVRKNKVLKRNENVTSSAVYYANTSSPNPNRRSDYSDHLYCYIDVNSLSHPKEIPKSRVPLAPCGERSGNGERSETNPNARQVNPTEVSVEECDNTIEEAEDLYTYAYADRFDILSILRSQEEARK
ncbi:hypothetical protein K1T71_009433 [Dendrolimus kikuchii]|uniref:Uncharacterized protein n=1 Tax=Dendrolimus kikuchii TaxID=765133 RepID=A0ACC1CUP1_9NEOP|nr:hypothetical protein K1T71_009433 [Dendrolimus kikuchii]